MPTTDIPVSGRVIAITGGARGIGRATAAALAREGALVGIGDIDEELAREAAAEMGGRVVGLALDVTDRGSFAAFLDAVERELGPLDVLINNAGVMPIARQVEEGDDTARRIIDINVHGVLHGSKLALQRMLGRRRGHVVNVASQAGKVGFGGLGTYCASKFAVVGYTAALEDELRGTGVHTTVVLPAVVRTELSQGLPSPKLLKPVEPEDVAAGIVAALKRPRRTVHVPRSGALVLAITGSLPPAARVRLERLLGLEHAAINADAAARAAYEQRAGREVAGTSEPVGAEGAGV